MKKPYFPNFTISAFNLLFLPLTVTLIALIFLILYPNDSKLQSLFTVCRPDTGAATSPANQLAQIPDFSLLIGILTLPDSYERRHLLRLIYTLQPTPLAARIDIRYIMCGLADDDQRVLVALEIMRYDDIIILDCPENMDIGKTYTYFSSLPKLFDGEGGGGRLYDFVMKADDGVLLRLPRLVESLEKMPRDDLYYGCLGYVLSWDLVEWIATSDEIKNRREDRTMWTWLRDAGKGKNRFDTKPAMYTFPGRDPCAHELILDTIAVDQLKDRSRWAMTLKYFNFTNGAISSQLN